MSDDKLIRFVKHHLDSSLGTINREQRERLKSARAMALSRQTRRSEVRLASLAGALHIDLIGQRALVRIAALIIFSIGGAYLHAQTYISGLEEVDSAILTDEMPMDVITDKGFDAWLRSSAEH